jgi:peptide/nickel transport system substrate-binding protein
MNKSMARLSSTVFLCLCAFAALLLPSRAACAAPNAGGTLNFVVTPEPPALLNLATSAVPVLKVSSKVTEGLLAYDFKFNPLPQLATAWTISPDGKRYTFELRRGVKWHDGAPFTSADVAYSLELLKKVHPRGKSTFANLSAVRTPSPYQVVLELSKPAPYLIMAFAASESPIVPKHLYQNTDPLANPNNTAPVGTGPFKFSKWVRGSYIEYVRNPDYWDKPRPYLDRIVVKVIPDAAGRAIAFENGSVDLGGDTPVPLGDLARLKSNPRLGLESGGYQFEAGPTRLEFNLDHPVLGKLAVRQAIAHALQRDVIKNAVFYGYATPIDGPIVPGSPFFSNTPSPYHFDLARANALLDGAGLPRAAGGTRFTLTLDPLPIGDAPLRAANYVKSALGRIGIGVTIRSQDLPAYLKRVYTDRRFDVVLNGMSNLFDPTVGVQRLYWSQGFRKGVPFTNASHFANAEVDALFDQAAVETDHAKRIAAFARIQRIVGEQLPDINLVTAQQLTLYNRRVHDHTTTANGLDGNFADLYLGAP